MNKPKIPFMNMATKKHLVMAKVGSLAVEMDLANPNHHLL
jgi:hypothetical protein